MKRAYTRFSGERVTRPTVEMLVHDARCYSRICTNHIVKSLSAGYFGNGTSEEAAAYAEQARMFAQLAAHSARLALSHGISRRAGRPVRVVRSPGGGVGFCLLTQQG